jgi:hypothetical protein
MRIKNRLSWLKPPQYPIVNIPVYIPDKCHSHFEGQFLGVAGGITQC